VELAGHPSCCCRHGTCQRHIEPGNLATTILTSWGESKLSVCYLFVDHQGDLCLYKLICMVCNVGLQLWALGLRSSALLSHLNGGLHKT